MRKRNQQSKGEQEQEGSNSRALRVNIEAWGVGIIGLLAMSGLLYVSATYSGW